MAAEIMVVPGLMPFELPVLVPMLATVESEDPHVLLEVTF
jgi:hypothetical protein